MSGPRMRVHHVETFRDDNGQYGWQCFADGCREEVGDFDNVGAADTAAEDHRRETATEVVRDA